MIHFESDEARDLAIDEIQTEIDGIQGHLEQVPLDTAPAAAGGPRLVEIVDGQSIIPAAILGIKFESPAPTLVTDDPTVGGTRADGLGRGRYVDTGEFIMVVHGTGAPYGVAQAHIVGDLGIVAQKVVHIDGPNSTTYHYIAKF